MMLEAGRSIKSITKQQTSERFGISRLRVFADHIRKRLLRLDIDSFFFTRNGTHSRVENSSIQDNSRAASISI